MQLPTLILDTMDWWHTYWMLLYNQFNNNISIAAKGEIFPELAGMNFSEKLVELWSDWYINPKAKYQLVKRFNKILPKFLPQTIETSDQHMVDGKIEFSRFGNPQEVAADKLWEIITTFKSRSATPADHHFVEKERKDLIGKLNTLQP